MKAAARNNPDRKQTLPLDLVRVERQLESFTPAFVRWFEDGRGSAREAMQCLEFLRLVFASVHASTGTCSATAFTADTVNEALRDAAESGMEEPLVEAITEVWHLYIDFLADTDRWTGTLEEHDEVHGILTGADEGSPAEEIEQNLPVFTDSEEVEAFSKISLIQRVERLLLWIGRSKEVTASGALRLKDVEPAAATVGVKARGIRTAKRQADSLPGLEPVEDASALTVKSMHEVPVLSPLWETLVALEYLELGSTVVRPGFGAQAWLKGSAADKALSQRDFVTGFLQIALEREHDMWGLAQPAIAALEMAVLLKGVAPIPILKEDLYSAVTSTGMPEAFAGLVSDRTASRLEEFADLGLLEPGTSYKVTPVIGRCVLEAFREEFTDAEDEQDFAAEPSADSTANVFQLRIDLQGAKPPIWRRVLVPSSMRLDELHQVIQLVFNWLGYHLHAFQSGIDFRGQTYRPAQDAGGYLEEAADEAGITIADLLLREGDRMTYTYDFGDDWEHRITLEKITDPAAGQVLPMCLGGRGAAPAEDSGGIWGWADKVEAANDPTHPEHAEIREWLGLVDGEILDPKDFDNDDADDALDFLRQ